MGKQPNRARRGLATVCVAALAAAGTACSGDEPEAAPAPVAVETVTAEPTPTPTTVAMTQRVEAISVASEDVLSKRGGITPGRRAMDEPSLSAVANSLIDLLRAHLDDLNTGGPGVLAELGQTVLALDPGLTALTAAGLASPDNPATAADVLLRVGMDGVPQWAQVDVDVLRRDGTRVVLDLIFSTDGDVELLVLGAQEVPA